MERVRSLLVFYIYWNDCSNQLGETRHRFVFGARFRIEAPGRSSKRRRGRMCKWALVAFSGHHINILMVFPVRPDAFQHRVDFTLGFRTSPINQNVMNGASHRRLLCVSV